MWTLNLFPYLVDNFSIKLLNYLNIKTVKTYNIIMS